MKSPIFAVALILPTVPLVPGASAFAAPETPGIIVEMPGCGEVGAETEVLFQPVCSINPVGIILGLVPGLPVPGGLPGGEPGGIPGGIVGPPTACYPVGLPVICSTATAVATSTCGFIEIWGDDIRQCSAAATGGVNGLTLTPLPGGASFLSDYVLKTHESQSTGTLEGGCGWGTDQKSCGVYDTSNTLTGWCYADGCTAKSCAVITTWAAAWLDTPIVDPDPLFSIVPMGVASTASNEDCGELPADVLEILTG